MIKESWAVAFWRRLFGARTASASAAEYPKLYGRRLERRRVLDAGPWGAVDSVALDAGFATNDHQHDHFEVSFGRDATAGELEIRINGELVALDSGGGPAAIRIAGSNDHDTLVISDHGTPGTGDQAAEVSSSTDWTVHYGYRDDGRTLQVTYQSSAAGGDGFTLLISDIEQVVDHLNVAERHFAIGGESRLITLADNGIANDGRSLLYDSLGTSIEFSNPSARLQIATTNSGAAGAMHYEWAGIDGLFSADLAVRGHSSDRLSISGSLITQGTSLGVVMGEIQIDGSISTGGGHVAMAADVLHIGDAGSILLGSGSADLFASQLTLEGSILGSGTSAVRLQADADGRVAIAGRIEALGSATTEGGLVAVGGGEVRLLGDASINVSGGIGGGTILLGGGLRGAADLTLAARETTIGTDVRLLANAVEHGNGGVIVVWADGSTRFEGTIEARGGAADGNGGLVEVSGKQDLWYGGQVTLDAPHGNDGLLLLDPATLTVTAGMAGMNEVSVATLEAAIMDIALLADLQVNFVDLVGGDTTIALMDDVTLLVETTNAMGDTGGGIVFQHTIAGIDSIVAGGNGGIIFHAGTAAEESSVISNFGNLTTVDGVIELTATGDISGVGSLLSGSGNIVLIADVDDFGGGTIDFHNTITSDSGLIHLQAASLTLDGMRIDNTSGDIELTADAMDFNAVGSSIAGGGMLLIQPRNSVAGIGLGNGTSGTLQLNAAELSRLQNGFSVIRIGDAAAGTGNVDINSASFADSVEIFGGAFTVVGLTGGTNDVSLYASTGSILARNATNSIDVTGQQVSLVAAGDIGQAAGNGALQIAAIALFTDTSGADGNQYLRQAGTVAISQLNAGMGAIELEQGVYVLDSLATIDAASLSMIAASTLEGTGTINANLTVDGADTVLSPGGSDIGRLEVNGDLSLGNDASLVIQLQGTSAGVTYDQLTVSGDVTLSGELVLSSGFTAATADSFVIVDLTDPGATVTGTFNGLAEGDTITAGGQVFQISYEGGTDGNDVVLSLVTAQFSIAATDAVKAEGDAATTTDFTFTVTRSDDTVGSDSLTYTVTGSGFNPANADDFFDGTLPSGTVTFEDGETTAVITISVRGDDVVELSNSFSVTLSDAPVGTAISGATASGTIINDDAATVTFTGELIDEDSGDAIFTVSLSNAVDTDITVRFNTLDTGTAAEGDFTAVVNRTITIAAGATSASIVVEDIADTVVELDETIDAVLDNLVNAGRDVELEAAAVMLTATGTIINDDTATITFAGVTIDEDSGDAIFTLSLSNAVDTDITVRFNTLDTGTAAESDFTAVVNRTVTIAAGATLASIVVDDIADGVVELDETIDATVDELAAAGRNVQFEDGDDLLAATGTIENDDLAIVTLSGGTATEDDGPLIFTVTLSAVVDADVTVRFRTTTDGTAASNDFTEITDQLVVIAAGDTSATVNVTLSDDDMVELDETVVAEIEMLASNGRDVSLADGEPTASSGTIVNDDTAIVSLLNVAAAESSEALTFVVMLSNPVDADVEVRFQTIAGGTATAILDYQAVASELLTITMGQTSTSFAVTVVNDALFEPDETVFAQLFSLESMGRNVVFAADVTAIGTIENDESLVLTVSSPTVIESAGVITFEITLGVEASETQTVKFSTLGNGTATAGVDFTALTDVDVVFLPGETSHTIDVVITADDIVEAAETINVRAQLFFGPGMLLSVTGNGTGTIANDDQAVVTITDVQLTEGDDNTVTADFVVALSRQVAAAVNFSYATVNDSASSAAGDFVAVSNSGGFAAMSAAGSMQTISVTVQGDHTVELDEQFFLRLSALSASGLDVVFEGGTAAIDGRATIENNDSTTISIANVMADEATGELEFTVTLTNPVDTAISVSLDTLAGGTATAGIDFTEVSNQIVQFMPGVTSVVTTVEVHDENLVELNETVLVAIGALVHEGRDVALGTTQATGTVINDDSATLTLTGISAAESDGSVRFTATLSNPVDTDITVQFDTSLLSTATALVDFSPVTGQLLSFAAEETVVTVDVVVIDDAIVEADESIIAELTMLAVGGRQVTLFGSGAADSIIVNDDGAALTVESVTRNEGTGGATDFEFTVSLSQAVQGGFTVSFSVVEGTASAVTDFNVATIGPLTFTGNGGFPETQTIVVRVFGDDTVEADETFTVALGALVGLDPIIAGAIAVGGPAVGTIVNDDQAIISVATTANSSVLEGNAGVTHLAFEIRLSNPTDLAVSADLATADGAVAGSNAMAGEDYTSLSQLITFNAGASGADLVQIITVEVSADVRFELDELLTLSISNPLVAGVLDGTRLVIGTASVTGIILNDDTDIIEMGGGGDDRLEVTSTGPAAGSFVLIRNGVAGPTIPFAGVTSVTFFGGGGDDQLTIQHNGGGLFSPIGGIRFEGQAGVADVLQIIGGTIANAEVTFLNADMGEIRHSGVTVDFDGTEQVKILPQSLESLTVIYSGVADDIIVLEDDGIAANGVSQLRSTAEGGRPLLVLANPQGVLSIDTGVGDDSLTIANGFDSTAAAGSFRGGLMFEGSAGRDQVTFDASLMLAAGEIRIGAEEIAVNAVLNTGGGNVLFDAAGVAGIIVMSEPAAIDAGIGTIDLRADNNVTVTSLQSAAGGIAVLVESRHGQILDGGELLADIIAPAAVVQLIAASGIGNNSPLETRIGTLDAVTQSGSIQINERDNLNIHRARIQQATGAGRIEIIADGSLTVVGSGEGVAVNNNSNVTLNAAGNLAIHNTSLLNDIHLAGGGLFVGRAGGSVDIAAGAVVRTSFGHLVGFPGVADAPLQAADLGGPGINIDANNRASLQIQLPPGSGFEVVIDWNDFPQFGEFEVFAPLGGGTLQTFHHQYLLGNPTGSATKNIPYSVRIEYAFVDADTNAIQFFSGGEPLALQLEGEFTVPLQGIQSFAITVTPRDTGRVPPPPEPVVRVVETPAQPEGATVANELNSVVGEVSAADVERVELRIVTPTGEEIPVFEWSRGNIDILKNLAELFGDLPDDRYRIYLIRPDGSQQLVVDVVLRQHRPFDPLDEAEADRSRPSQYQAELNPTESTRPAENSESQGSPAESQPGASNIDPLDAAPESDDGASVVRPRGQAAQPHLASAAFGAAAWAALRAQRIDGAQRRPPAANYSLTKAARTARRLLRGKR